MIDKFWDSEEVEGKYLEVIIDNGDDEIVYWVSLANLPHGEDEYDWAVQKAHDSYNKLGLIAVDLDDIEACEPFSRNESEFTFIQ